MKSQRALRQSRLTSTRSLLSPRRAFRHASISIATRRDAGNDLSARFFFDAHGVREDPATGNGAAFLGAYLLEHRVLPEATLDLRIEQGFEVHRPSLVLLRARTVGGHREISVGGRVIPVVRGELL